MSAPAGPLYLGLDVGTQSTKGLVVDVEAGRVVARAAHSHGPLPERADGAAEQDPELWWSAVRAVVRALLSDDAVDRSRLAGLGVSGQQHGLVALDAEDRVIRPAKLWCDTQTAAEARELGVPTGFTASKLLWLARHEPHHHARLASVLLPHDWIDFRLTGTKWMEAGDASGTGWFDPAARGFDPAAMERVDPRLPEWLPPLVEPRSIPGHVSRAAAEELGLPPGLPVAPGAGDNMASAIGAGAVAPGPCVLSLGTSATVFTHARSAVVDPAGLIAPFCDSTGHWLPLLCTMNATGVTEELCRGLDAGLDGLTAAAEAIAAGADGLLLLPFLAGERVPDLPTASGSLLGLRHGNLTPGHLFRAALEGTSLNLAWGVERLRRLGIRPATLHLVGGAARNGLWCRILATLLEVPVRPLAEPESAALGAALQAAWAVDPTLAMDDLTARFVHTAGPAIEPEARWIEPYRELRARFDDALERLHHVPSSPVR